MRVGCMPCFVGALLRACGGIMTSLHIGQRWCALIPEYIWLEK
jgi:hypothetical protein